MSKQEFLAELRKGLSGLPQSDIEERMTFYSEMIDDRIEEGLTEEDSIAEIGTVQDVVSQIMSEIPLSKLVKEKVKPKRTLRVWEIVLLVLGSPIWLSLLIAAFAVALSVYIVIWSVVISLYAIDLAFVICGVAGILVTAVYIPSGSIAGAGCSIGAGLVCFGISVLLFFGCNMTAKYILLLTKNLLVYIKSWFIRKGDEK